MRFPAGARAGHTQTIPTLGAAARWESSGLGPELDPQWRLTGTSCDPKRRFRVLQCPIAGYDSAVTPPPVLVLGASGFVGRHACVALQAAGYVVRRATSDLARCESTNTNDNWVHLDVNDRTTYINALRGCRSVVYLFHGLGTGPNYANLEAKAATELRDAAVSAGVQRIIYLGGVAPIGPTSKHLASRRATGEILRDCQISVIELRAAMIIGMGSTSFNLVRDLTVRLPVLVLPTWLDQGSCPIAINDVVYAIVKCLGLDLSETGCYDLPGPEWLTHRQLLTRISSLLGTRILPQRLAALTTGTAAKLLGLISRQPYSIVAELVAGLQSDLTPTGHSFWTLIGEQPTRSVMAAIIDALADETSDIQPSKTTQERIIGRVVANETGPT